MLERTGEGRGNRILTACLEGGNFTAKYTPSTSLPSRTSKGSISLKFPRSAKKPRPVFGSGGRFRFPRTSHHIAGGGLPLLGAVSVLNDRIVGGETLIFVVAIPFLPEGATKQTVESTA